MICSLHLASKFNNLKLENVREDIVERKRRAILDGGSECLKLPKEEGFFKFEGVVLMGMPDSGEGSEQIRPRFLEIYLVGAA